MGGDEKNYAIQIRHVLNVRNTLYISVQNIEHWINKLNNNIYFCSDVYMQILSINQDYTEILGLFDIQYKWNIFFHNTKKSIFLR